MTVHEISNQTYSGRRNSAASAWRVKRHVKEAEAFENDFDHIIRILPGLQILGNDPEVTARLRSLGIAANQAVVRRVAADRVQITLVAVSARTWHNTQSKFALLRLRTWFRQNGSRILLVPQRSVRKQPRRSIASLIASYFAKQVSLDDRQRVLARLQAEEATILDCTTLISGSDPLGSVLALVAQGLLTINLQEPIGPYSKVRLRRAK